MVKCEFIEDRNLGSLMYLSPMPKIISGTQQVFDEYLRNE